MPVSGSMLGTLLTFISLLSVLLAEKSKCTVCRDLTKNFKEHYDKTKGHNFGGGNTAWEEKSLGTYATSETRLVEILENTCGKSEYKCGSMLEDQEEFIEEWFFKRQDKTDLFEEMCVEHLKKCCLKNRWGPDCAECPGGTEAPCSGHGKCHGEGDREKDGKLSGTCTCDRGYNGTLCEDCKRKFIRVGDLCEECSSLCEGQCTAPGTTGCVACVKGYELVEGSGCTDINECEREGLGCGDPLEDCMNSAGSYECVCKSGYTRVSGQCQLEDLYASEDEADEPSDETKEEMKDETKEETSGESTEVKETTAPVKDDDDYEEVENKDEEEPDSTERTDSNEDTNINYTDSTEKDEL